MREVLHNLAERAIEDGSPQVLDMKVDWMLMAARVRIPDNLLRSIPIRLEKAITCDARSGWHTRFLYGDTMADNIQRQKRMRYDSKSKWTQFVDRLSDVSYSVRTVDLFAK